LCFPSILAQVRFPPGDRARCSQDGKPQTLALLILLCAAAHGAGDR